PDPRLTRNPFVTVYPRSRGGTKDTEAIEMFREGLSPLARGNPPEPAARPTTPGSIPARAGEPRWRYRSSHQSKVYPRSRGGTGDDFVSFGCVHGLSPLARG